MTLTKLVEVEINHIVKGIPVKSPTEFDMDPSFDGNINKVLSKLLTENVDAFATSDNDLKYPPALMKMYIDAGYHKLIALKQYRIPLSYTKWLEEQTDKLLNAGLIRPCTSPWCSPGVLANKKDGLRLCIDLRKWNSVKIQFKFHIPFIEEILFSLGKSKHFSSLGLR